MMKKERSGKAGEKIIFHIDVNSAFLSWSAVKKLRDEPGSVDLRTIPSAVGGDRTKRHGIITAKSGPAGKYGIKTAEPVASALKKCPGLVLVPSDFQTYREYSLEFIKILRSYTTLVEQASIDEAFMDATEICRQRCMGTGGELPVPGGDITLRMREAAMDLAEEIRGRILGELGFTVNVGISGNRLLAKMASDFEKPDRTHTLFPEEVPRKMWPLPIGELHGCGRRTSERLRTLGIQTIGDAAKTSTEVLIDHLGDKSGKYIHNAANGISRAVVSPVREDAKSYSNEWTTSSDITQETYEAEFIPLLQHLCDKVAGRLQRDGVYGKTVVVTVKTDDFRRRSAQRQLPDASNKTEVIFQTAAALSDKLLLGERGLFAEGAGIRLVGAGVTDLDDGEYRQMSFLDWEPEEEAEPEENEPEKTLPPREKREFPQEGKQRPEKTEETPEGTLPPREKRKPLQGRERKLTPPDFSDAVRSEQKRNADRNARLQEMEERINRRYGAGTVRRGTVPDS